MRAVALMVVVLLVVAACTSSGPPIEPLLSRTLAESATTTSPDGRIDIEVGATSTGEPVYRITAGSTEVIGLSRLGLETSLGSLSADLELVEVGEATTVTDAFHLPTGKAREAETTATVRTLRFESAAGVLGLEVDVWVSDDAAAFRSRITGAWAGDGDGEGAQDGTSITVDWERTSFAVAENGRSWLLPYDRPTRYTPAYEAFFTNGEPIDQPGSTDGGWGFPALFELDASSWVLLTEAGLTADYAATRLGPETLDGEFVVSLPDQTEGNGFGERAPTAELPITTPWRVAIIGDLSTIVSSNAVRHLGAFDGPSPNPIEPPAWIEPGRVSWSWWADHASSRDASAMAEYVEFAAEIGWEYSLIDANWNEIPDDELAGLIDLAEASGVELFLWYNSGGPNNDVTEAPRDLMFDREVRRAEFARIAELGIAGVKVDFFQSDKQETIARYLAILEDAADFELLVNVHGSTIPRGWERAFPNLMTMESVRGAETYTFDSRYAANAATHNTILPFTRNVIGSMDYTPVIFSDEDSRGRLTTDGHELALSVVFESGLQHFVDTPDSYRAQPDFVIDFLAAVPVVWDETVLLDGMPGSHAVLARRNGDTWYLGAINGTAEAIDVSLDWSGVDLGAGATWHVICDDADGAIGDGADRPDLELSERLDAPTTLTLAPYGGCVSWAG